MAFWKKKEKVSDPEKKKGCLKKLIIGIVMVVGLGIITIISIKDTFKVFGVNITMFNEYMSWLNEDVDESKLVANPIKANDIVTFKQKAEESGLGIYDANGNINFNIPVIDLDSTITLYDYEVGAMINNSASTKEETQMFSLLELTIIENTDGTYKLKTVVKFDLKEVKKAVGKNAKQIPNYLYITSQGTANTVGSRVQTNSNTICINNLSNDKNDKLVSLLSTIMEENKDEEISNVSDINNYIVTEVLTTLAQKTSSKPKLGNHTLSYTK